MAWRKQLAAWVALATAVGGTTCLTGCQTTVGGQTLPSPHYLTDDVQFFPAGPEFLLPNQVQALEQFRLEQQQFQQGLIDGGNPAGAPGGAP